MIGTQRIPAKKSQKPLIAKVVNNEGCTVVSRVSRVNEREAGSWWIPPQRYPKMSLLLVAVVALGLVCFQLDPRDLQSVLACEGIHPNPGPDGVVKKEVEVIEERALRKGQEDARGKAEGGKKKQRCTFPYRS